MHLYFRLSLMREKDVLRLYSKRYYGLVLEAHTLELYSNSMLNFLKDVNNPFIVDPVTYKFALPTIEDQIDKRWYEKLVDAYKLPLDAITPRITPDKLDDNLLENHVENVVNYQRDIARRLRNLMGLLAWFSEEGSPLKRDTFSPEYIISPYFIIESINHTNYSEWLHLNRYSIDLTRENLDREEKLLAIIALGEEAFLSDKVLDDIFETYRDSNVDALALWVSNFDEITQAPDVLRRLIIFAKKLKRVNNVPLFNFYGGYFSLLLSSKNVFDNVVQGITVAEHRDPFTPGGFAIPRYYLPILHLFTSHEVAGLLSSVSKLRCQCPICKNFKGFDDFVNMSVMDTMEHFVYNRVKEAHEIEVKNLETLLNSLKETYIFMDNLQRRSKRKLVYFGHLKSWIDALKDNEENFKLQH